VVAALRNLMANNDACQADGRLGSGRAPPSGVERRLKQGQGKRREGANSGANKATGALRLLGELLQNSGSVEGRSNAARALYNPTCHDAGWRQVAGLGYTQDQLDWKRCWNDLYRR
jgi:hypothetical protein